MKSQSSGTVIDTDMARTTNNLTVKEVQNKAKQGYYSDGGNLYLQVSKTLSKSWLFRYKKSGKKTEVGLGSTNAISLSEARKKAAEYRNLIANGFDPLEVKRTKALPKALTMTFSQCADSYIDSHRSVWKNPKHIQQWENTIEQYCNPIMGGLSVANINTDLVIKCLTPIWFTKNETADRLRGRIECVLDWAKANKHRTDENPARWRGHLDKLLPKPSKVQNPKHHTALPFDEIKPFIKDVQSHDCMAARCLEFTILTAARTGESIAARWCEIDMDAKTWTLPKERMKANKEHVVLLADRCVAILVELKANQVNEYVFAGQKKHISNMAMLNLLKRMGRTGITVHGFRSTFVDWASETMDYSSAVIEMCLAHTIKNQAEAAYRRGNLIDKRRIVMDEWQIFCLSASQ